MIETNYVIDDKKVSYEILEDGYKIYLDDVAWIHQYEPYIPYPNLSYEEGCLKQIEEIVATQEQAIEAEKTNAELMEQVKLQDEAINELASLVSELMMAQESEVE